MKSRIAEFLLGLLMVVIFFPASALAASMDDVPSSIGVPVNVGIEPYVDDGVLRWFAIGVSGDSSVKFAQLEKSGSFERTSAYQRLSGETRIDTAIAVSQEGWPQSADTVILTRDDLYPDALTGTPLSKKLDAPILFTNRLTLTPATGTEINRLNPKKVIILGGTAAVSSDIENALKQKYVIQRIGGYDMYETAEKIAAELGYKGKVVIATGEDFHDALIAAPLAAYKGIPMLLTEKNGLPAYTKNALNFIAPSETIVVGNNTMVSDSVMSELTNPKRYSGIDYYQTAVVAAENFKADVSKIFFATGRDFPDALTGSALAAKFNNPILFVNEPLADSVRQFLVKNKSLTKDIHLLGGEVVIPQTMVNEIMECISSKGSGTAQNENAVLESSNPLKECNWTVKVSDTQKGSLNMGGKQIDATLTLELLALKNGGTDVYGKYTGKADIKVDIDISKLSDEDIIYINGATFNRKCDVLEFSVIPYDSAEYIKHIPAMSGKVSIAPLGYFNAMANFQSDWSTVLNEDWQAKGENLFYDGKRSYGDAEQVPIGINCLIEGAGIKVEIPTYSLTWNVTAFKGTVTGDPIK